MNKKPVGKDWCCDSVRIVFRTLLSYPAKRVVGME